MSGPHVSGSLLYMMILQTQVGVIVFSLPLLLYQQVGIDSWIPLMLGGLITQLGVLILFRLHRRFPRHSLPEMLELVLGRWAGKAAALLYTAYFTAVGSVIVSGWISITQNWVYPRTPDWIFKLLLAGATAYLLRGSLGAMLRFYPFAFAAIPILILLILATYPEADMYRLLPIGLSPPAAWLQAALLPVNALLGFELMLFLLRHSSGDRAQMLRSASWAIWSTVLLYVFVTVSCLLFFGDEELTLVSHPVLYQLKSVTLVIVERTDVIILSLWVLFVITSFTSYMYMASHSLRQVWTGMGSSVALKLPIIGAVVLTIFQSDELQLQQWRPYITAAGIVFAYTIPLLLLLIGWLKQKSHRARTHPALLILAIAMLSLLLSGCWDRHELKRVKLIQGSGFEASAEGVRMTSSLAVSDKQQSASQIAVLSGEGRTIREARVEMSKRIALEVDSSKSKLIVVDRQLAEKDLYEALDVIYRDPRNPLDMKIAISKDSTQEIMRLQITDEPFIGIHIRELLESSEKHSIVPKTDIQQLCSMIFSSGQDGVVPIIGLTPDRKGVRTDGAALLHNTRMTGTLDSLQTTMLLLLQGKLGGPASLTLQIDEEESGMKRFVTVNLQTSDTRIDLRRRNEEGVVLRMKVRAELIENPNASYHVSQHTRELESKLAETLERMAADTIRLLQEANCDAIGIGRKLKALDYAAWRQLDWAEAYPQERIRTEVKAKLIRHGILQ